MRIKLQDITVNSCIRLSIQRSFVFASGTPTPIVVDLFGESTITSTQLSDAKVDTKAREAYRAKIHFSRLSSSRPEFVR